MLHKLKNRLLRYYLATISSIAFYPTFISIGMMFLALFLLSFEDNEMTKFMIEKTPYLVINNAETARTILGTLIGGILTLTVFSFSMVMVLLNQASTNFSPRLLPGLISDKRNQIVLGVYLGTIIFNIIVLISILPSGDEYTLNGFSVLLGIAFGIFCLSLFVFFIHTISTGIQINNILDKIFDQTKARLLKQIEQERNVDMTISIDDNWHTIYNKVAGYYQGVNIDGLLAFAREQEIDVLVIPYKGKYLLPNMPIVKYSKSLKDEDESQLFDFLIYSNSNSTTDNYVLGIRQITEVGIKAMSPGINDPGTAVMTIDYLTELIALRMQLEDREIYVDEESGFKVELKTIDFDELIFQCLAAYRQYCKHDLILMEKLVLMIKYLLKQKSKFEKYHENLKTQLNIIEEDVMENIQNSADRDKLKSLMQSSDSK